MSGGLSVEQHIDSVDAYARTLFLRARHNSYVADAVRHLHSALRQLRIEAADPDSPLHVRATPSPCARQLTPLVDDCRAALRQLDDALDDGRRAEQVAGRLRRLRVRIDDFLDAVQLQSQTAVVPVARDQSGLEGIKDKVDDVAKRVFSRRDSGFADDEDKLWREFKTELEKEGFAPEVLRRHKDVLRAYIRGLDSMSNEAGGSPPTIKGLLQYGPEDRSPKEMYPACENEKFAPSMKTARRLPTEGPPPLPPKESLSGHSSNDSRQTYEDDYRTEASEVSMALISTRDLAAMDGLSAGMDGLQLSPQQQPVYGASPNANQRYLPSSHAPGLLEAPDLAELPGSPNSTMLGTSPQVAPLPTYSSLSSGPPPYGTSPRTGSFRLAPDRYGNEIPMDAQWTKINRDRVSPEVLERAGVRYEARPTYVAILGLLTKEQIADFARQSADVRAARYQQQHRRAYHDRSDCRSSHEDDDTDSELFDSSDSETNSDDDKISDKGGARSHPFIVSPPDKEKSSPSSTVPPKSILKNKNEHHVRFDPQPHELESKSPRSIKESSNRESSNRRRPRTRSDDHHHQHGHYYDDRDRDRDRGDRPSRRHYDDRDRDYRRRDAGSRRRDDYARRDRDREENRRSKKKAWGETLGAVGIGGAAVSLLSVLAEAASTV